MKTVLLNLPHKGKFVRRYSCSWESLGYLPPPLELLYLASVIVKWEKEQAVLIDAVAEKISTLKVVDKISEFKPDLLVAMTGLESFKEDMACLEKIKESNADLPILCFGYYPTLFPAEILEKSCVDYIIMGEPELTFSKFYNRFKNKTDFKNIDGLAYKNDRGIKVNNQRERNLNLDDLPYPDRSLLKNNLYSEMFFPKPFTVIQSSRGCPHNCSMCVRTYGRKLSLRTPENVINEIEEIVNKHNIRNFRFSDDNFICDRARIIKICEMLIHKGIKTNWVCSSRADSLDYNLVQIMKRAGCKRIFTGIESGVQETLDYYEKSYNVDDIKKKLKDAKHAGMQIAGFFMVGFQIEDDFKKSIKLAKEINLDYIMVERLMPYPGTKYFNSLGGDVEFSLFPYINKYKDRSLELRAIAQEREIYKTFCLRWNYAVSKISDVFRHPMLSFSIAAEILKCVFLKKSNENGNMRL